MFILLSPFIFLSIDLFPSLNSRTFHNIHASKQDKKSLLVKYCLAVFVKVWYNYTIQGSMR